jgi:tetratricopeptide (TPR) repeat protein
MGKLTAYIMRSFRAWDRSTQIAMLTAIFLFLPTIAVLIIGTPQLRQPALIGFIGLIIATQIIFMWGNRTMVTPYTQAQRHYLNGDFDHARQVLENLQATGKVDVRSLTLLGNTYRQLSLLVESEEVLTKALDLRPFDHFPLYGIGRTLLVKGLFAQAAAKIKQALDAGAPNIVQFDLAEALYRQGSDDDARLALRAALEIADEPHRALMAAYMLYRLGEGEAPAHDLVAAGLPYWRDSADRFLMTPYGQMLADDVQHLQALMEEE